MFREDTECLWEKKAFLHQKASEIFTYLYGLCKSVIESLLWSHANRNWCSRYYTIPAFNRHVSEGWIFIICRKGSVFGLCGQPWPPNTLLSMLFTGCNEILSYSFLLVVDQSRIHCLKTNSSSAASKQQLLPIKPLWLGVEGAVGYSDGLDNIPARSSVLAKLGQKDFFLSGQARRSCPAIAPRQPWSVLAAVCSVSCFTSDAAAGGGSLWLMDSDGCKSPITKGTKPGQLQRRLYVQLFSYHINKK